MQTKTWDVKALLLVHIAIGLLILSWTLFPTRFFWHLIDHRIFLFLNNTFLSTSFGQNFWAFANHKTMDWCHDVVMISFFMVYVFSGPASEKWLRFGRFIFTVALFGFTIVIVNKWLIHDHIKLLRDSPSLVYPHCIRLSQLIDWIYVKDYSRCCFPSDHGTMATLFAGTIFILMGKRARFLAFFYAIFFSLPRMIVGAHWASDLLIGSLSITLCVLSWGFCTPLCDCFALLIKKIFTRNLSFEPTNLQ